MSVKLIINIQRIVDGKQVILLDFMHTAVDCSVTSVGNTYLFTTYSYVLVLISVIVI